jgi:hypothetical protein
MTSTYATERITKTDAESGFRCGKHALDDYFARHAFKNDEVGVGRAFVLRRGDDDEVTLPIIFGFYTLSMAAVASEQATEALKQRLP